MGSLRVRRASAAGVVFSLIVLWSGHGAAQPDASAVLSEHGCLGCHSLDGRPLVGPTFVGLFARETTVVDGRGVRRIPVDEAYVRRAILDPSAEVVSGYRPDGMPAFELSDEELERLVRALRTVEPRRAEDRPLLPLGLSTALFVLLHLGLSFHPVRSRLVGRIGAKRFQGLYSVLVLLALGGMILGWTVRPFVEVWSPPAWTRWVPNVLMPLSFVFLVAGYSTKNPASAGQEAALAEPPRGVVSITRHPALVGIALWAFAHLAANGDLASILLFGGLAVLVVVGMLHIDRRRARVHGAAWRSFAERTSVVPFLAILRGKTRLDLGGLWWRALLGLLAHVGMLHLHEWEFGVSPFPY